MKRLDAGEDAAQVMKDIEPPPGREGPGGMGGMGGPGGGRDGLEGRGRDPRGGEREGPRGDRDGGGRFREGGKVGPRDEPGRAGPRGGREGGAMGPVSDAEREELMGLVRRHAPLHLGRVERLRESNPAAADRLLKMMAPRLVEAEEVQTRDPELYNLRVEEVRTGIRVLDGVRDYREALKLAETDPTRAEKVSKAEAEMRSRLDAAMTVRLKLQERDVVGLEQRLAKLREEVAKKQSGRSEAIEEAMKAIRERRQFRDAENMPADSDE